MTATARDLIPLENVPELLPIRRGKKFHRSAIFRWANRGKNGVKLQTIRVGRTLCTTDLWLMQFLTQSSIRNESQTVTGLHKRNEVGRRRSFNRNTDTEAILARHNMDTPTSAPTGKGVQK